MRSHNAASAALLARLEAGEHIPMVQLVEIAFTPTTERYCTAGITVQWGGFSWLGLGLGLEPVEDAVGDMPAMTLSVPAVSPAQISLALTQQVEGTTMRVYDALVDPATGAVADAVLAWAGELSMPALEDGPKAVISVLAEHRGTVATRNRVSRYTHDEQQRLFPGDTALNFDPATDAAPLVWPAASFFKQ